MLLRRKITNLRMEEGSSISTFLQNARTFESTCWVDRREDPLTRKLLWSTWCPHYLSLRMSWWWAQSPTPTRCLLSRAHYSLLLNEEIRCEVKTWGRNPHGASQRVPTTMHDADILVARTTVRYQLERLGCTISSCAHVKNLLQNSNVEALMINWPQAPPWALADLVDIFQRLWHDRSKSNKSWGGECKWYVDSGAKNKLQ